MIISQLSVINSCEQPVGQCISHKATLSSQPSDRVRCNDSRPMHNIRKIASNCRMTGQVVRHSTNKCITSTLQDIGKDNHQTCILCTQTVQNAWNLYLTVTINYVY